MKKILLTGGTGFFGKSILDMVRRKELTGYEFTILSRNPEKFLQNFPEFSRLSGVNFISGDVRDFQVSGTFDAMILGATPASVTIPDEEMRSIIIDGTTHSLEIARRCGVKKLLFISSGAVYGKQSVPKVSETDVCKPFTAYGIAKKEAEEMCFASGIPAVAARCFAFTGKYLDRNIHFAIGNFIRDALAGEQITVKGDGKALRSYLYADDLVIWLFNLLEYGCAGKVYNVGSDHALSIAELAHQVADILAPGLPVKILGESGGGAVPQPYVPDISASREAGLSCEETAFSDAVKKSANVAE
ncbi:MAG: NAD(P)-dependent oxidoreductase [Lentisphaeria bacterium]|nr:NAD(P)-dependent oxidoreductase [Lentisphaeria bacterium]